MKQLLFSLLICFPMLSFAQWQLQTIPTTADLNAVNYLNGNNIFIGRGTYFHVTTDGGLTWSSPIIRDLSNNQIFGAGFSSMHFFSPSSGVVTGPVYVNSRAIISTVNGGYNWGISYISNTGLFPREQDELFFPSPSIGYSTGTNGVILKSTDGGASWIQQSSGTTVELFSVYFTTNTIGYTSGHNIILHTNDGGNNWIPTAVVGDIQKIWFANDSTGYAAGDNGGIGVLYKTTNYGVTWTSMPNPFMNGVSAIAGLPNDTLYVCSTNRMYYSMNGGIYWNYFPITVGYIINDIDFIPNTDSAYAVGNNAFVIKTINGGGNSFAPVSSFSLATIATVCAGDSLSFNNHGDPAWSFQWLVDNNVVSTSYNSTITFPTVGNHLLSLVSYNGFAYDTSATIIITVNPLPAINGSIVTQLGANPICVNSSSTIQVLNSQPGVVYQLRNGITQIGSSQNGNNGTLTFNTGTISSTTGFNIYAVMTNGCGSVNAIHYDTINVAIVNQSLQVTAQPDSVCNGSGTNIVLSNSVSGVTYKLRKNTTVIGPPQTGNGGTLLFPTGNITTNTTYNILATNPTGCFAQETQTVLVHVVTVTATISLPYNLLQTGDTLLIPNTSSGSVYTWNFGANANPLTSTSTTPSVSFSTPGIHMITLQVTSNPGCVDYDTAYVTTCQFPSAGSGTKCWDKDYSYRCDSYYANPGYKILDYCTDIHGNSYATGYYDSVVGWGTSYNMIIMKFDSVGNLVWQHKQNPWIYNYNDYRSSFGTSITADDVGNFYVGGSYAGSHIVVGSMTISSNSDNGYEKPFLIKFDSNGNPLWNFQGYINSTNGTKGGSVTDIIARNSNNIYFAIGGDGTSSMGFHYADGSIQYGNNFLNIIHINGNGGYISNTTATNSSSTVIPFYCVFNPNISSQNANLETYISPKIAIVSDTLYVGLMHFTSMDFGSITITAAHPNAANGIIAKMDLNTTGWISVFRTFSNDIGAQGARPVFTVNNSGNIFVAWNWNESPTILYLGNQTYAPNSLVTFVAKYTTSGNVIWAEVSNSDMWVNSLSYLEGSNQLISYGRFGNALPYYGFLNATSQSGGPYGFLSRGDHDIFISSYSGVGDVNWIRHIGGSGYDNPFFMRSFNCEQVGIIAQSDSTSLFDSDTIATYPAGNIFVVKFSATGNCGAPTCSVPITYASANASIPTICSGNCTPLNFFFTGGTPPFSYVWMPGNLTSSSPNVCPNTTTTYTCTITDANNFTQSASTTVTVNASPVVTLDLSPIDTLCASINSVTLLPSGSPAGGTFMGPFVTNNTFSPSSAGSGTFSISYTYTNSDGCSNSAYGLIFVDLCSGISPLSAINSIQLYPNPVSNILTIDGLENTSMYTIEISNSIGEVIYTRQSTERKTEINLSEFQNGVYCLKIKNGENSVIRKIVKAD